MINFLNTLIKGNKHNLSEVGANYDEKKILLTSLLMLEKIKDKIIDME